MGKSLVIVESPAKARTISRFLGSDYIVESSIGHIRDLPKTAKEVPPSIKKEPWGRLAIDVDDDFKPHYVIPAEKKKQVTKLKQLLKEADTLFLATDEDREGESISWHLCEVLKPKIPSKRLVFHEITRDAIRNALENPREIDDRLVRAQETRRILDRLYGFEISPVLWKKIAPRLSAGRVQSVAVRMIIERERARIRFVPAVYWDLNASFNGKGENTAGFPLHMQLVGVDGKRLASGRDFNEDGKLKSDPNDVIVLDQEAAGSLLERLKKAGFEVGKVESKPYTEKPSPPFTTSTLQQEANRKLRYPTRVTMQVAQRLYENGFITYMRTDSTTLSEQAVRQARNLIADHYGQEFLPGKARTYQTKVKNAQEAHEAIRPAGDFRRPEELKNELNADELKIYDLIWKRTVACQMENSRGHRVTIQVVGGGATFQASGKTIDFPGFLRAYVEGADDPQAELADKETILPNVLVGDPMDLVKVQSKDHRTQPPPRYTEASLVKELEARGVGRPSTYASIIDTILHREYVIKQGTTLIPTFTAFAVVGLLEKNFGTLVDSSFTASMEDDLDAISRGEQDPLPYLKSFYFGAKGDPGLKDLIQADIDARETCTLPLGKDDEGRTVNIRIGRFGPFIERGEDRASIPADMPPDALNLETAEKLLQQGPTVLGPCPDTEANVYLKSGRYGPYVQLGENDEEPKMKSVPSDIELENVDLTMALAILALPRALGTDTENGEEVFADYGRYGAYLKRGSENRSFKAPDNVLTIKLDRALQIFKETPARGRSRSKTEPIKELGVDKGSGNEIRVMNGRYGPYVTDGDLNASLRRGTNPEEITMTEALELLQARAERLASGGGRRKKKKKVAKKASKKTAKKATGATKKKAAKKKTKKKTAAKKKATAKK